MKIRLRVISQTGRPRSVVDLSTTINLRNFNEVDGCLAT
jgi:hypothetical protein